MRRKAVALGPSRPVETGFDLTDRKAQMTA